jgi:hypothetical protein
VPVTQPRRFVAQFLRRVLADRLEQPVPRRTLLRRDERPVDQPAEHLGDHATVQLAVRADLLGGGQGEATGEDGQPAQQDAFRLGE